MKTLKPPMTYEEQIENLIVRHGLIVEDKTIARQILSEVNYYRLSAYGLGLYQEDAPERFRSGVSLEHIYALYRFDSGLRNLITPVIEYLEIELRTKIAYQLARAYGAEGYRNPAYFLNKRPRPKFSDGALKTYHQITMEKLDREIAQQQNHPCVKHHMETYGGHFPIWVAIELFTFGMLASLYSVMLTTDRKEIALQYRTRPDVLNSWILALVEVRNICAHYGRIYNMPLAQSPYLFKQNKAYASNKIFPALLTMKRMTANQNVWTTFFTSLGALIEQFPEANLSFMGFPVNWDDLLF